MGLLGDCGDSDGEEEEESQERLTTDGESHNAGFDMRNREHGYVLSPKKSSKNGCCRLRRGCHLRDALKQVPVCDEFRLLEVQSGPSPAAMSG